MSEDPREETVERLFTPNEARAALRLLQVEIAHLRDLVDEAEREGALGNEERRHLLRERMEDAVMAIRERGVTVKGLSPLLLDFPGRRYGADVWLCWKDGERDVLHWHPRHKGFADRRPLDGENPGAFEYAN